LYRSSTRSFWWMKPIALLGARLAWAPDNRSYHAGFRCADLDRTTCFAVSQLLVDVENPGLQCIDVVGCRDRNSCELVLRIVHLSHQSYLAPLALLHFRLRLHAGLLTKIHFIERFFPAFE